LSMSKMIIDFHVSNLSFRNNSIEVNLLECDNKERFEFESLKSPEGLETESPAGKVAQELQIKANRLINRRRG